jgi:hypothetical protein
MKKGLLTLLAAVMAFGVAVQSMAGARLDAMASNPRLVEDYDSIFLYANKVLQYKNTVDFRMGNDPTIMSGFEGGDDEWGGILIEEESLGGVLGVYVNRPQRKYMASHNLAGYPGDPANYYWYFIGGSANSFGGGFITGTQPAYILDLFYGKALDGADLGVHVSYGDNGVGGTETSVIGLELGLGFADFGPFNEANIRAGYGMYNFTDTSLTSDNTDNGVSTISLGGFFSADAGNDTTIRLSGDFQLHSASEEDYGDEKSSEMTALLGLGCNHQVNGGKGLVSTGLLMSWTGGTFEIPSVTDSDVAWNSWHIYWNASVEAAVANWLTLRTGIQKALLDRAYEEGGTPAYFETRDDDAIWTAGFGITWQNFTLDALIDINSLQDLIAGPNAGAGIARWLPRARSCT